MTKRRTEVVAASLLETWTDSDTAMQIVGSSLGIFGTGLIDPTRVLSDETPLRNALFDVLLSLVEGGALEMRPTDDGRYAFRWRADIAVAGISPEESASIDIAVPSPFAAELAQARAERDDALGRADFAEALAAERERLLRLAGVRSPNEPAVVSRRIPPETHAELSTLDTHDESVLDALYGNAPAAVATKPAAAKPAARKAAAPKPAAAPTAAKKSRKAKPTHIAGDAEPDLGETSEPSESRESGASSEVVYLSPPTDHTEPDAEPDEASAPPFAAGQTVARTTRRRWSGYAIEKARPHLSSVDRIADEG